MDFAETLISRKLKGADSTLDLFGTDRRMLHVAVQDFSNYLMFNRNRANPEPNNFDLSRKIEHLYKESPAEVEAFLTVWTGIWLRKWKERIKLLIGKKNRREWNRVSRILANAESNWRKLHCKEEIIGIVISTLIKNAEICGTEILSESLVKMELGKKKGLDINSKEQVLAILNNTLRRAREMVQKVGPLINVKIGKNYFCLLSK